MSTKDLLAGSEGKMLVEINKLQGLIDADIEGLFVRAKEEEAIFNAEWLKLKALLLGLKPIILDSTAVATVKTRLTLACANSKQMQALKLDAEALKTAVENKLKDRMTIIGNCHKVAAGGVKKGIVTHGQGWSKVVKLINSVGKGGIKEFKGIISNAVPSTLKSAEKSKTGPKGSTDQVSKGLKTEKAKSKEPISSITIDCKAALLRLMENTLSLALSSDFLKPGTDAHILDLIRKLESATISELDHEISKAA